MNPEDQLKKLSLRSAEVISEELLLEKIKTAQTENRPLRVKAGFDPSCPDIHLGHTVLLDRLRAFQDLGHQVIFIIGDATARVGDPSGRSQTRPTLSGDEIERNAKTYQEQAFKILDPSKTQTVYNNEWFGKMTFHDMMSLASRVTVSQIIQREDFQKRLAANTPISLLELFYPLMQAYDSVKVTADIELGGTDQKFNLLMGRELQRAFGMAPQAVMTLPLLVGLDGVQKMSKSLGNHVGIQDEPQEMFGKIMSISDELMFDYDEMLFGSSSAALRQRIKEGDLHPKKAKEDLAKRVVARFHTVEEASRANEEFLKVFSQRENPTDIPEFRFPAGSIALVKLLTDTTLAPSGNEARRLIRQGAISIDGTPQNDVQAAIKVQGEPQIVKAGKRKFAKIVAI